MKISRKTARVIRCPECHERFEAEVYEILDSREHPQELASLLGGTFNEAECPSGHVLQILVPVLIHLAERRKLVFFSPGNPSQEDEDREADRLMGHFFEAVRQRKPYMEDLMLISSAKARDYHLLTGLLRNFEPSRQEVTSEQLPASEEEKRLSQLMIAASREPDPAGALRIWRQLLEATQGTDFRLLRAMALGGIGTAMLKITLRSEPSKKVRQKQLSSAARSLTEAIDLFNPATEPEQWAVARVNLASILSLRAEDPWQGFLQGTQTSLPVLTELDREAAPEERALALHQLRGWYSRWLRECQGGELPVHVFHELDFLSAAVLSSLDENEESAEVIHWLDWRGLTCLLVSESIPDAADRAVEAYLLLLELVSESSDPEFWVRVQQNLGAALGRSKEGDPTKRLRAAVLALEACLRVYTEDAYPQKHVENSRNLGHAALELGKHLRQTMDKESPDLRAEAESALNQACILFEKYGPDLEFALAANELGLFYRSLWGDVYENNERALHAFILAESKVEKDEHPETWATIAVNIGVCLADRVHADRGVYEYLSRTPAPGERTEVSFGGGSFRSINLHRAAETLEKALTVYRKDTHPVRWATTSSYLATVQLEAVQEMNRLGGPGPETVQKQEEAIQSLEESSDVLRENDAREDLHKTLFFLACAYGERLKGDRRYNLERAVGLYRSLLEEGAVAIEATLLNFLAILLDLAKCSSSVDRELLRQCGTIGQRVDAADFRSQRRLHTLWAEACHLAAENEDALEHYLAAIQAGECLLRDALTLASKNCIHQENVQLYRMGAGCALDLQGKALRTAFLLAQRAHSALLADQMSTLPGSPPTSLSQSLVERERQLLADYRSHAIRATDFEDTFARVNDVAAIRNIRKRLADCWREMEGCTEAVEYLRMRRGDPIVWQDVENWLGSFTSPVAMVIYISFEERLVALIVRTGATDPVMKEWPLKPAELEEIWADFEHRFIELGSDENIPDEGWPEELAPILESVHREINGSTALFILPDRRLHGMPLHSIRVGARPMIAHVPVAYTPSLPGPYWPRSAKRQRGLLRRLFETRRSSVLIAGDPTEDLPYAADEARAVAKMFGVKPLLGRDVTKEILIEALRSKALVHFAGHASFESTWALESGLELYDDRLSVADILPETLRCQLLVLSACSSGRQRVTSGGDLLGLPRACLVAGVGRMLASLWPVEDVVAHKFMTIFYQQLIKAHSLQRPDPIKSMQTAALALEKEGMHPYSWAPFIIYGLPRAHFLQV